MYKHVSQKSDFYYNTNFDNIDAFVDGIVGTLQNALNKFCPIFKVKCSHDNDKHKPWLTNEIKALIKEKFRLSNKYPGYLCLMVTSIAVFEIDLLI